jgi:uncharacterized repeat protein (TIGR03803 family)
MHTLGTRHLFWMVTIAVSMAPVLLVRPSHCQTVSHVYSFTSQNSSQFPAGLALVQGRDWRLCGTTSGSSNGSIFRITRGDVFAELFALGFTNGCCPYGGVTLASDGNFYGTTQGGGNGQNGVLFKMTPTGTYTVLHFFAGGNDGADPAAAPIQASDGSLYGTTVNPSSGSTVYKYTFSGSFGTIHQFSGKDGQGVVAALTQGADGNLYGVASAGGANGCGTVFQLSTAGAILQSYSFPCGAGGNEPTGSLLQASDGNLYGTTALGGSLDKGTVFKMTPDFQVSILYNFLGFGGGKQDGRSPFAGLVQATDGNLYGTTKNGGSADMGTLFQISPSGAYKSLYSFRGRTGKLPLGGLMQHTSGLLFGTASQGGANGLGTVFALDVGLGPFVTFVQATGKVGQTAQILGQGFTGTTGVTFNSVPAASFTVGSGTYLRAVIPSGATTGPVVVTTPKGTLTSNVNFVVSP